jgi:RNA recognition motif-containing protein
MELMQLLSVCGRVTKMCLAGDTVHAARFAFVEFATAEEAALALRLNGQMLGDRPIRVNPSKVLATLLLRLFFFYFLISYFYIFMFSYFLFYYFYIFLFLIFIFFYFLISYFIIFANTIS